MCYFGCVQIQSLNDMYKRLQEYNTSLQQYNSRLQSELHETNETLKQVEKEKSAVVENLSTLRGHYSSMQEQLATSRVSLSFHFVTSMLLIYNGKAKRSMLTFIPYWADGIANRSVNTFKKKCFVQFVNTLYYIILSLRIWYVNSWLDQAYDKACPDSHIVASVQFIKCD